MFSFVVFFCRGLVAEKKDEQLFIVDKAPEEEPQIRMFLLNYIIVLLHIMATLPALCSYICFIMFVMDR